jgi:tRNA 2-thiouridine synthesizing protein E
MSMITFGQVTYALDAYGFLADPECWDRGFAEGMATRIGISSGLTDGHWRVISHLRRKLEQEDTVPYFVLTCMDLELRINDFRELFPTGYMRGACKAAGLSYAMIAQRCPLQTYENLSNLWMKYELSPMGFLASFEHWDEKFANLMASEWDLPCGLTEAHWRVIRYLRRQYAATGKIPLVYQTCRDNNLSLDDLKKLFPGGYRRGACRMAGLPLVC